MFVALTGEKSIERHCLSYWNKYREYLSKSTDELLLYEQANLNLFRSFWLEKEMGLPRLYRSKRFVPFSSTIQRCVRWRDQNIEDSVPMIPKKDLYLLRMWSRALLLGEELLSLGALFQLDSDTYDLSI